jgi:4-amino-4-deoxy-L-arabinose transferase-like glycosyltransferase
MNFSVPGLGEPAHAPASARFMAARLPVVPRSVLITAAAVALATVLRLVALGSVPGPLSHDEAVKGYDAWSILHTGRDQYGERLPLVFRSIGDYREAAMPYLIALSEAAFGPTDFAVRLPAALAGVTLVLGVFLLGRELFDRDTGLLAMAFLAISPWHVQVSRLAFRAGLTPVCVTFGLWLLLRALRRGGSLVPTGLVLGLALHTYLNARAFLPLLLVGITLSCGAALRPRPRRTLGGLVALAAMAAPLALWAVAHPADFTGHAGESFGWREAGNPFAFAPQVTGKYAAYLGPGNLLLQGDPYPVPSTGRFGVLYWPELPLFVAGVVLLARRRGPGDRLVLWWLLTFPLAPALADGAPPDWLRSSTGLPVFELIAAAGGVWLWRKLPPLHPRRWVRPSVLMVFGVALLGNVAMFLHDYTVRFPHRAAWAFHDGASEAMRTLAEMEADYATLVIPKEIPGIHDIYLFYSRYDPHRLLAEGLEDRAPPGEWADVRGFGKVRVCEPRACCRNGALCLVLGRDRSLPIPIVEVRDHAGRVAFTIVVGRGVPVP